jgi:hypothetical protein
MKNKAGIQIYNYNFKNFTIDNVHFSLNKINKDNINDTKHCYRSINRHFFGIKIKLYKICT